MNDVTLRGTHVEIGRQIGEALRSQNTALPELTERQSQYADQLREQVEGTIPWLFEEMEGLSEAGDYDQRATILYALSIGIVPACTVIAVAPQHTESGRTLFGRNYDAGPAWAGFTLQRTYADGSLPHIGCFYDLLIGREGGVNEAGLAIAVTGVEGKVAPELGLWDHIPVRAVLDRCRTVDEAVSMLTSLPHLMSKSFLVADASGEIAIVEAAGRQVKATQSEDGFAVITNHFVSSEMEEFCDRSRIPANSVSRLETAQRWFEEARGDSRAIRKADLMRLLSSTEQGVRSELGEPFTTRWSWVSALGERTIELCDRLPDPYAYSTTHF